MSVWTEEEAARIVEARALVAIWTAEAKDEFLSGLAKAVRAGVEVGPDTKIKDIVDACKDAVPELGAVNEKFAQLRFVAETLAWLGEGRR